MAPAKQRPKPPLEAIDAFLTQQDMLSALLVWAVLEGLSLLLLPHFTLFAGEDKRKTWILMSAFLGVGGALLIGLSSSWLQYCQLRVHRQNRNKSLLVFLGNVTSCIGLIGIGLPLITVFIELMLLVLTGKAL
ncbi:MAG: hypothetical protein HC934_11000 [Acaryochloridaceae cyanobacterium SU_2_1]|nr:hypothetical protein [Acaryochloridaceae cyanobacterium SU_2_1]